jgi:hypothetical protein
LMLFIDGKRCRCRSMWRTDTRIGAAFEYACRPSAKAAMLKREEKRPRKMCAAPGPVPGGSSTCGAALPRGADLSFALMVLRFRKSHWPLLSCTTGPLAGEKRGGSNPVLPAL